MSIINKIPSPPANIGLKITNKIRSELKVQNLPTNEKGLRDYATAVWLNNEATERIHSILPDKEFFLYRDNISKPFSEKMKQSNKACKRIFGNINALYAECIQKGKQSLKDFNHSLGWDK